MFKLCVKFYLDAFSAYGISVRSKKYLSALVYIVMRFKIYWYLKFSMKYGHKKIIKK